jgi:hypothetical protein
MRRCLRADTLADYQATYRTVYDGIRRVFQAGKPVPLLTDALFLLRPEAAPLIRAAIIDATNWRQPRELDATWLPSDLQSEPRDEIDPSTIRAALSSSRR